jgi:RNA polymerase sigma-70 factor (ECF subfamily)
MTTHTELPDDGVLLARIGERDPTAFALLYDRYARLAFGYAVRLLHDEAAAEAVLEKAFHCLWRQAGDNLGRITVRDWLLTLVDRQARVWSGATRSAEVATRRVWPASVRVE